MKSNLSCRDYDAKTFLNLIVLHFINNNTLQQGSVWIKLVLEIEEALRKFCLQRCLSETHNVYLWLFCFFSVPAFLSIVITFLLKVPFAYLTSDVQ